jgi:hypothetical protein
MPVALLVLAICLAANVLLGPLGAGISQWHVSAIGINQTFGADAVPLVLVAPTALIAMAVLTVHLLGSYSRVGRPPRARET